MNGVFVAAQTRDLAVRPGRERDLHLTTRVVDAIPWLHVVGVDVREPAYTAPRSCLEVLAMLVQEDEVVLVCRGRYTKYQKTAKYQRTCSF